ncbi:MAG: insecticidal toxin-like protein, partial [Fibrobacter sp.]|nr:insecticidal toxin-like protein [Fibrobacter sp.]
MRDDKTPFFEELEERIQEFSDDHANLENALFEYLEKIREVSSIEIIGATKENGGDEGGILYTLHIVGRTQGEPHTYYYRKYKAKAILSGEWTPWERLDVDIPSETVVPAIVNQRLYLLWPQITVGQRNIESASEGGLETIEYYARIQVCWTSYTGTKWTGTRMSKNALYDSSTNQLDFALGDNESIEDRYNLKTETSLEWVKVAIIKTSYHYQEYEEVIGSTEVMDGSSKSTKVTKRIYDYTRQFYHKIAEITISADGSDSIEINPAAEMLMDDCAPERTRLVHGVFKEEEEFTCGDKGFSYPENNAILNYTPGRFRIVSTNLSMLKLDEKDKTEDLPFFYMDGRRTFFVQPVPKDGNVNQGQKNYRFELISHSLVDEFYKRYRDGGTKWLYTRETQALPISDSYYYSYSYYNYYFSVYLGYYMAGDWQSWDLGQNIFRFNYRPDKKGVDGPYPAPMVDFVWGGANAMYNWELFFYVPMLIAEKMIAEQSYEEALLWLQLVFDPRMNYSAYERTKKFARDLPKGARYWKFLPFFVNKDADKSILQMLGLPTKRDKLPDRTALSSLVDKWKNDPFNPHLIARYRKVAYQKYVVMKYLDALIGWGDQEFAKDTTESVNLAIQFYLLAAELLGPKNAEAPEPEPMSALTAND